MKMDNLCAIIEIHSQMKKHIMKMDKLCAIIEIHSQMKKNTMEMDNLCAIVAIYSDMEQMYFFFPQRVARYVTCIHTHTHISNCDMH
jgi:hypothetical protein